MDVSSTMLTYGNGLPPLAEAKSSELLRAFARPSRPARVFFFPRSVAPPP